MEWRLDEWPEGVNRKKGVGGTWWRVGGEEEEKKKGRRRGVEGEARDPVPEPEREGERKRRRARGQWREVDITGRR